MASALAPTSAPIGWGIAAAAPPARRAHLPTPRLGASLKLAPSMGRRRARTGCRATTVMTADEGWKLVGCGGCGIDYLASVAAYPSPDDKLRTDTLEVQGGGNAGNALTAAARLGASPLVITKVGGDGLGQEIAQEMQGDGIDTSQVLFAEGHPSPFTYIIVDRAGSTRTCIHTPGAPMEPKEVTEEGLEAALAGARLVYFDGRLTEAAIKVAEGARARGIPVLVEAERLRPALDGLLALADYIVTSKNFPGDWTGEAELGDALLGTLASFPNAKWMITTLGVKGSVLLQREQGVGGAGGDLDGLLKGVMAGEGGDEVLPAAKGEISSKGGGGILSPRVAALPAATLAFTDASQANAGAAEAKAFAAAAAEALKNASGSGAGGYSAPGSHPRDPLPCSVLFCDSADMGGAEVVDTTGAGDAFIGSVCYGVGSGMPLAATLALASTVAAAKCTALGPRPGLPRRADISPALVD